MVYLNRANPTVAPIGGLESVIVAAEIVRGDTEMGHALLNFLYQLRSLRVYVSKVSHTADRDAMFELVRNEVDSMLNDYKAASIK